MYGLDGRLLRFSAIGNPIKWTPPSSGTTADGSGYIDLSSQDADSTDLIGMEVYYDQMAIFSSLSTQFWTLDPDPANNHFDQLLRQTGLVAPNGITQFGSGDVIYLSPYGIRSLRVQNISLTAGTTDIGTPIDTPVRDMIQSQPLSFFLPCKALIQPRTGRLWMVMPDRMYVLSTFQEPAITAWSLFDPTLTDGTTFTVSDACIADPYVMLRATNGTIYRYAGNNLNTYDGSQAEVILPALSLDKPSDLKTITSFDIACSGTWQVSVGFDPNDDTVEELVATVINSSFNVGMMRMPGWATHVSMRLRTTDQTPTARVGKLLIHYQEGSDD
jgi:hypothetical protein